MKEKLEEMPNEADVRLWDWLSSYNIRSVCIAEYTDGRQVIMLETPKPPIPDIYGPSPLCMSSVKT